MNDRIGKISRTAAKWTSRVLAVVLALAFLGALKTDSNATNLWMYFQSGVDKATMIAVGGFMVWGITYSIVYVILVVLLSGLKWIGSLLVDKEVTSSRPTIS